MATVLIADDSSALRLSLAAMLEDAGHEVIAAVDGAEALEIAGRRAADLVITDLHMPRMDGLTLIAQLRRLDAYRFTPILVLTTEAAPEIRREARVRGATGWMAKPLDEDRLERALGKALGR